MNASRIGLFTLLVGALMWPADISGQGGCIACEQLIHGGSYYHRVVAAPMVVIGVTGSIHDWISVNCSAHGHEEVPCNSGYAVLSDPEAAPILEVAEIVFRDDRVRLDPRSGTIEYPHCDGHGLQKSPIGAETRKELMAFLELLSRPDESALSRVKSVRSALGESIPPT